MGPGSRGSMIGDRRGARALPDAKSFQEGSQHDGLAVAQIPETLNKEPMK